MNKFPKVIHVQIEKDGDDSYLMAYKDGVQEINEDGAVVAVYELKSVGKVVIEKRFETKS